MARLNDTDAEILRRATGQRATEKDAQKIVKMIRALRTRYAIDRPLDPVRYRPLQPGGEMLPGDTYEQRDAALYDELQAMGHPLARPAPVASAADAERAVAGILGLDLRTVNVGLPMARWTEDGLRGAGHLSMNDGIPDVPRAPKPGREAEWYALHDGYIANPTDENLWKYDDRVGG